MTAKLSVPQRINADLDLTLFDCGSDILNDWLKRRALRNDSLDASRTFVVCQGSIVVAYYALAVGSIAHTDSPSRLKRNMPNPLPVMLLGRLAIDKGFQGRKLGAALLKDAVLRTLQASESGAIKAIVVHAIDENAKAFYERYGFIQSPSNPMTLLLNLRQATKIIDV